MEAEELQLLLKIRQGILNGSWEEVTNAWNEISGESLEPPVKESPEDKLKRQIQEQLNQTKVDEELVEDVKNDDIVKIERLSDDQKKAKTKKVGGPKRRETGVPKSMKKEDGDARYHDTVPDHIRKQKDTDGD